MPIIIKYIALFSFVFILFSCKKNKPVVQPTDQIVKTYLHLSHPRTNTNPLMDHTVEHIDYTNYDMLWLGGDLAHLTSLDDATMEHVDSIFDLGSKNTLWALGNHDYSDLDRVEAFTNRPAYYATHQNGITFIVLDTQDSLSNITGNQKDFLWNVLDTLQTSSHLIILHHKLIWMYNYPYMEDQIPMVSNGGLGDCFYCINPNNFNSEVYPKLLAVKQKGIAVLCIGGDIGFNSKQYEYRTPEGIYLMASGIKANDTKDKALIFQHNLTAKTLTWGYVPITQL